MLLTLIKKVFSDPTAQFSIQRYRINTTKPDSCDESAPHNDEAEQNLLANRDSKSQAKLLTSIFALSQL